ncbi:MAG: lipopolysaccharide biosynthesis protein [Betaproteobacteria bacterium]|nr:lipopolysaccharide biosynthesis protein [Betaproteobacteria bacterium]NBS39831.1 lipopolysaccharide biosynthesis protein [Betaproteobacteria bacterium]NBT82168.1 lipopolysaccharide biosynthesis protein [Betaproteobacteria bacterium]NCY07733.1 lipopolysaccharide biosynthesis protein [Betaproteobacteria bacterium]NDC03554.1 lipopolysaccharide biosynthesis protein [Betaproteobacteria bacterium]
MADSDSDDEISLLDLLLVLVENIRLLIAGPLAAGAVALGVGFMLPEVFTAKVLLMPPQQQQSSASAMLAQLGALAGAAGAAAGLKSPSDQFVALMRSSSVENRLIDRFDLMRVYESKLREDARRTLEARTRIDPGKKDGLMVVEVEDNDPKRAAEIANAYVEELSILLSKLAVTEAQQRRVFFERQLMKVKEDLTRAQLALKTGGTDADILKTQPQTAVVEIAQLSAQVTAKEVELAAMRSYLKEAAPDFKQALNELAALRAQLDKSQGARPTPRTEGVNARSSDYISRFREYKYQETLFDLMARQFEIAKIDESREGAIIQVIDAAEAPERKSKPKKALIAVISALATGFALLLFVFIRRSWRQAMQDQEVASKWRKIGL